MKLVRDVMLALDDLPTVHEDATVVEAIRALEEADQQRPSGRPSYRVVLVVNRRGQVLGKMGHRAFLKALEPGYESPAELQSLDRAGVDPEVVGSIRNHMRFLQEEFPECCRRARSVCVGDAVFDATETIEDSAPLMQAVTLMLKLQTLSLLVRRGEKVVGLLRQADVFQVLVEQVLEAPNGETYEGGDHGQSTAG